MRKYGYKSVCLLNQSKKDPTFQVLICPIAKHEPHRDITWGTWWSLNSSYPSLRTFEASGVCPPVSWLTLIPVLNRSTICCKPVCELISKITWPRCTAACGCSTFHFCTSEQLFTSTTTRPSIPGHKDHEETGPFRGYNFEGCYKTIFWNL